MKTNYKDSVEETAPCPITKSQATKTKPRSSSIPWLQIVSNLFFVLGSVLYLVVGIDDLEWSHKLRALPHYVRTADDDVVWVNYRLEERYNKSLLIEAEDEAEAVDDDDTNNDNRALLRTTANSRWLQFDQYQTEVLDDDDVVITTEPPESAEASNTVFLMNTTAAPTAGLTTAADSSTSTVVPTTTMPPAAVTTATTIAPTLPEETPAADYTAAFPVETTAPPSTLTTTTTTVSTATPAGLTPSELYDDEWWADLPGSIQDAYGILGYNSTIWDEGGIAATDDLEWLDLSPEQQAAAEFIGYTEESWDGPASTTTLAPTSSSSMVAVGNNNTETEAPSSTTGDTTGSSELIEDASLVTDPPSVATSNPLDATTAPTTATESITPPGYYDDYDWEELPPDVQEAAILLGYNERIWNSGGVAASEEFWWMELTPEQRQAAAVLGYDEWSWNGTENPNPNGGNGGGGDSDPASSNTDQAFTSSSADDDDYVSYDDDYLFQVGKNDTDVSRYMVLYFSAALCFVFVGGLDLIREKKAFHLLMIVAGLNGVVSAMLVEKDVFVSNIFNALSVHFFLLEALTLFGVHKHQRVAAPAHLEQGGGLFQKSMTIGDGLFLIGSLLDVILSYFFLLDDTVDWDSTLMSIEVFAATCWLACSLIYISGTIYSCTAGATPIDGKGAENSIKADEEHGIGEDAAFSKSVVTATANTTFDPTESPPHESLINSEDDGEGYSPTIPLSRYSSEISC